MNPTRRKIPSRESKIACNTKPAGPSFSIPLKTDAITQSEAGIGLALVADLAGYISVDVLTGSKLITQSTSERVSGEASDLINLSKVFAAHAEENVADDATLQGEAKLGPAGRRPRNGRAHKAGTGSSDVQRPSPLARKVHDLA